MRIKKTFNRPRQQPHQFSRSYPHTCSADAIARILVYSMAVDGEVRDETNQKGYRAGSRALDSLDRLVTSTESFFHPSNSGPWTILVSRCHRFLRNTFSNDWPKADHIFTTADI
jgi:hypothetical protein